MMTKLVLASAIGAVALLSAPLDANAGRKKPTRQEAPAAAHDCKSYNGPSGYEGNPWCDGGWKYAEDWAPGTGGYLDAFDLPQVQRLRRRFE